MCNTRHVHIALAAHIRLHTHCQTKVYRKDCILFMCAVSYIRGILVFLHMNSRVKEVPPEFQKSEYP